MNSTKECNIQVQCTLASCQLTEKPVTVAMIELEYVLFQAVFSHVPDIRSCILGTPRKNLTYFHMTGQLPGYRSFCHNEKTRAYQSIGSDPLLFHHKYWLIDQQIQSIYQIISFIVMDIVGDQTSRPFDLLYVVRQVR